MKTTPFLTEKQLYWERFLFILAGNAVPLYGVIVLHRNFFFLIYIYWFESLIHIFFNGLRIRNAGKKLTELPEATVTVNNHVLTLADYNNPPRYARLYWFGNAIFLSVYVVFIIVILGIVFPFSLDSTDMLIQNVRILFFRDMTFNLALLMFIVSSTYNYVFGYLRSGAYKVTTVMMVGSFFERENLVLHLTLIFGIGLWFLVNRSYPAYKDSLIPAIATGFVLLKTMMDLYNFHTTNKKSL